MARIPESEVERLKREVSVQRLAEARGIKLHRHGADLLGLCPFHDDRNPSLVITPAKNLWHCLGACNEGGTVIDWVMKANGISFRHAVELLREDHLPLAADPVQPVKHGTVRKLPPPVARDADDRELLLQVVSYYSETLKQSPEAMRYLESRGLKSPEIIDRFRLGFANRTLGYRLPAKNRAAGAEMRGRLQKLGILRESGHEHFNGSLVIPVINPAGDVMEMYGRKVTPNLREGTPSHLYLPGEHRGVWNEEALAASKEVILCEALIDALTFWVAGFRNVTASYGVNGFTADHRAAFAQHGIERVYIAYDRDEAGNSAAAKLAEDLMQMGIECFRVLFPKDMDANSYALKVQPAAKSLGVMLNKAEWLGKGQRPEPRALEPMIEAEPEPSAEPESSIEPLPAETKAATKEKIIEVTPEPAPAASIPAEIEEQVFSLAASPEPVAPTEPEPGPAAPAPTIDVPVEMRGEDIFLQQGERRYRIRGLHKNLSYELMKVNVLLSGKTPRGESAFHVDTLDLYSARQRSGFTKQAAEELGIKEEVLRRDLGRVLMKLEETAGRADQAGACAEGRSGHDQRPGPGRGAGAVARSAPVGADRRGLRPVRRGGRGDQQARGLSGRGLAALGSAARRHRAVEFRGGQEFADGSRTRVPARRAARSILRHDGAVTLLHGRAGPETQGTGHRGGRGRAHSGLCVEAVAVGRRVDHRQHRQRPGDGPAC